MALESNLRDRNILPSLPIRENRHNGLMIENKSIPQPEKNVKQINLDNEYLRLRVEKLEFALKRYELLEKIMSETGRIPR
jgi:ribosomal protein S18